MNIPLEIPKATSPKTRHPCDLPARKTSIKLSPIRIDPSGTNPHSTLSPESLPANKLPIPTPNASHTPSIPQLTGKSDARIQNPAMQITVNRSARSFHKVREPVMISANGFQ